MEPRGAGHGVSQEARGKLIDEVEEAAGKEAVEKADLDVDRAIDERPHPVRSAFADSKLLIVLLGATAVTVGVVAALATGSWWFLAVAVVVHGILTAIVVAATMRLFSQVEKPDPNLVTKLEDEGVADPEPAINDLVSQAKAAEEEEGGDRARSLDRD
jgi:hypothetical protein